MAPQFVFVFGLIILGLFGWYFSTEQPGRKRWLGLVLTVLLTAFCVEQFTPPSQKIRLGLDLKGGTSFLLQLVREPGAPEINRDLLGRAVEVIRKRVDSLGVSEPDIAPQGSDRILVQIAGLNNEAMEQAKAQLQKVAKLEFAVVLPNSDAVLEQVAAGQAIMPPGYVVKVEKSTDRAGKPIERKYLVPRKPDLGGEHVRKAFAFFDQQGWGVSLELDGEGAQIFDNIAAANQYKQLAILLDGEVISAPTLNERQYHGRAQITGSYTEQQARDLASSLENPLRVPLQIVEVRSVSPTLGADSIKSGVLAGLCGLALVCVFVLIYYRCAGLIALLGLTVNLVLLLGLMAMFNFVLTLPGIAGIILTIGMAVDANVLVYERLREELHAGKSLVAALNGAYEKAFSAIVDANLTTLITSVILFMEASGSVKGFAVTLTLGIIASMFSALLVTRTIFRWLTDKGGLKQVRMLDIAPKKKFDFLGKRRVAVGFSLALILGSLALFAIRGQNNFGIDFRGGDLLGVESSVPLTVADGRKAVNALGMGESAVIQMERQGARETLTFRSPEGTGSKNSRRNFRSEA
jgi:SecD/SecF fusion protein